MKLTSMPKYLAALVMVAGAVTGTATGATSAHAATSQPSHSSTKSSSGSGGGSRLTVATFNMLGDSHTRRGGNKAGRWAQSPVRTQRAVRALRGHGVDVAGLQEFQRRQQASFRHVAGKQYAFFSGQGRRTDNAVMWRRAEFRLVSGDMIKIPYFHGHQKPMPVVKLADRRSGQKFFVASFHNPANTRGPAAKWRKIAANRQNSLVDRLEAAGLPVFVTGDMNERKSYFCKITAGTDMKSSFGGSHRGGRCRPPKYDGIDWIFGNRFVDFSHPVRDRSRLVRSATDHPLVVAHARIKS